MFPSSPKVWTMKPSSLINAASGNEEKVAILDNIPWPNSLAPHPVINARVYLREKLPQESRYDSFIVPSARLEPLLAQLVQRVTHYIFNTMTPLYHRPLPQALLPLHRRVPLTI